MSQKNAADMPIKIPNIGLLAVLAALALPAQAVDLTWSGFATAGLAFSDKPYTYQRFIDERGTFKRDSIFGAQLDARLSQQWSATVQAKVAPSDHSDSDWQASLAWAFVSWRPSDDWLFRAGKIRLPMMLNTENHDVGSTFDFARLPQEVYSMSPLTDIVGLGVSKTWFGESMDWIAEAYAGKVKTYWRYYGREMTPDQHSAGSWFLSYDFKSSGLVLTARSLDNTFRLGAHRVEITREGGKIGRPIVNLGGVYQFGDGGDEKVIVPLITAGASVMLPANVRLMGEYAWLKVDSSSEGLNRWGAYLSLSKRIGVWTPYVYYATAKSRDSALQKYQRINSNVVPAPYAASQKFMADIISPYDQSTAALGTSYRLTSSSLIKTEWSQVNTGVASSLVDAPSGGDSANKRINVFSMSYNVTF
ncbi:hypothetical protein [Dechloromonas sp. HYN0024]|uniref:hypothetical protein n=1 Tax=Dechloromonas sp. HYN0024 TaxID=2231055 RepID=UPI000E4381A7|nr:hypothetical protein [Dechloromonas sp. HYN0024]AXS80787.1 hypothetical protein HYN24_12615 [Dechloromonas sp. HYN0024]